jgi:hypothetical protein
VALSTSGVSMPEGAHISMVQVALAALPLVTAPHLGCFPNHANA